jgi:phage gp45-like
MLRFRLVTAQASAVDADKFLGVQSDAHGKDSAVGHFGLMHPFGFSSRPVDPDSDGKGCIVLEGVEGHQGFSWLAYDPRFYGKIPPLSQGSSCQYNSAGAFIVLDSDKQTSIQYQPYTDGITKAHKVTIGKAGDGKPVIELKHGDGQYLAFKDLGAELRGSGNAYYQAKGDNCTLNGNGKVTGSLDVSGGIIPVAMSVALAAYLTGIELAIVALATAIDAKIPSTPGATVGAINTAIGALAAAKAAIPSLMIKGL